MKPALLSKSTRTILVVATAALALGSSCSSEEEPEEPGCANKTCPFDYSSFSSGSETVSFQHDVLPVFRRACGISSVCHGSETKSAAKLYLGPRCAKDDEACTQGEPDAAERQAILNALVNQKGLTTQAMNLITESEPKNSFLMLKMDGCHNQPALNCTVQNGAKTSGECGDAMPQGNLLCDAERMLVRRWIAQGAQNN